MIKARACAGDIAAGEAMLDESVALRLAQISRLRRGRRRARDEAADQRLSRPRRNRRRRPQHQARPRRHPRNRVFRADPAIDRRRPQSGLARPRHAHHAGQAVRGPLDRRSRARRDEGGLLLPAHGRASPADGERRADADAAGRARRGWSVLPAFWALPTATPLPRCCSAISTRCSAITRVCSRRRPAPERAGAGVSRRTPTIARRSTGWPSWASARRWRPRSIVRQWLAGEHRSLKGEAARSHLAGAAAGAAGASGAHRQSRRHAGAVRPFPRQSARRRRGCCRCCGKIPNSSR